MKRKILIFTLVITIIISALSLSSCGNNVSKNPTRPDYIPEYGKSADNPVNELDENGYRVVAETDNVKFEFNDLTTDIRLTNKLTNFSWTTEYVDDGEVTSGDVFSITYNTTTGTVLNMTSGMDSVEKGQFIFNDIENGVHVQYGIGDVNFSIDFPLAISPERADQFVEKMDEDQQMIFRDCYTLIDYSNDVYNDPEQYTPEKLELHKKNHPLAVDHPWYYMTAELNERNVTDLHDTWFNIGYNADDLAIDSEGVKMVDVDRAEFNVEIEYQLVGDNLRVTIPEDKIYYPKNYTVESIDLHPYLMDFDSSYSGYFTLPDGSGSLMNFNSGKNEMRSEPIYIQMYGVDDARGIEEKTAYYNEAILPVYGCTIRSKQATLREKDVDPMTELFNEKDTSKYNGLFATILSGDTFAGIQAAAGSPVEMNHNNAFTQFRINECMKMATFSSSNSDDEKYSKYQFQRYLGDITLEYHMLSGNDATYSGMAQYYKSQLFGDEKSEKKDYYSTVETMGSINGQGLFLGISYNKKIAMTNFDQVYELAKTLKENGFTNMNIKLSGWCNGGYEHGYLKNIKVSNELGGEQSFEQLLENMKKENIGIYPDVDYQYVYLAEKSPSRKDVSYSLNNNSNYLTSLYNPITFRKTYLLSKAALTTTAMTDNLNGFLNSYSKYDIKNISMRSIGSQITANYREEDICERQETLESILANVKTVKEKGYSIMGTTGDAPFLSSLDVVNNMPIKSSGFDKSDYSIPFTSMVLSGRVDYTADVINLSNNDRSDLLEMIEAGAGAYYVLTAESYEDIASSDYFEYYSTKYDSIKESVLNSYKYLKDALNGTYGLGIVKHEILANKVNMVTYEDGTKIIVNHSATDYNANGISCKSKDYIIVKGA